MSIIKKNHIISLKTLIINLIIKAKFSNPLNNPINLNQTNRIEIECNEDNKVR